MNARKNRGLAAVELALVLPLFAMLLVATAELGRALYQYNTLNKSVRDATQFLARYANTAGHVDLGKQLDPNSNVTVETTARNLVVYGVPALSGSCNGNNAAGCALLKGMDPVNDVTITPITVPPASAPTYVQVTAQYDFLQFSAIYAVIPTFSFGSGIAAPGTMKATVTMVLL